MGRLENVSLADTAHDPRRIFDVLRDLGTKRIGDTNVDGYRLALKNPPDDLHPLLDPVELWVDQSSSLPVEFTGPEKARVGNIPTRRPISSGTSRSTQNGSSR